MVFSFFASVSLNASRNLCRHYLGVVVVYVLYYLLNQKTVRVNCDTYLD